MGLVLVTGATGMVGRHLAPRLKVMGREVRTCSRRAAGSVDRRHVPFDWQDPATWEAAVQGADTAWVVKPSVDDPAPLVQAFLAVAEDVERVVLLSEIWCDTRPEGDPQRAVEQVIAGSGRSFTILRPNWFFQNLTDGSYAAPIIDRRTLALPLQGSSASFIDTRDVAEAAAIALTDASSERNYTLTGSEALDASELASVLSEVVHEPIAVGGSPCQKSAEEQRARGMSPATIDFLRFLCEDLASGRNAIITDHVKALTGHEPIHFAAFAAEARRAWIR